MKTLKVEFLIQHVDAKTNLRVNAFSFLRSSSFVEDLNYSSWDITLRSKSLDFDDTRYALLIIYHIDEDVLNSSLSSLKKLKYWTLSVDNVQCHQWVFDSILCKHRFISLQSEKQMNLKIAHSMLVMLRLSRLRRIIASLLKDIKMQKIEFETRKTLAKRTLKLQTRRLKSWSFMSVDARIVWDSNNAHLVYDWSFTHRNVDFHSVNIDFDVEKMFSTHKQNEWVFAVTTFNDFNSFVHLMISSLRISATIVNLQKECSDVLVDVSINAQIESQVLSRKRRLESR